MAETASLVHAAFNSDDSYSTEIKHTMRQTWLWAFTGTLFVPKEGAFIQDYLIQGIKVEANSQDINNSNISQKIGIVDAKS